ncbi:RNA polymerase-associated protein RapA [bioreactor metagenome]|uniref:RNA polymerase-associated protein RapA n=1 Tax=bioreactor metagenome TaxID=1076179 RepID=A0A644VZ55_9ZZZZ
MQTPFHVYCTARMLECLSDEDRFIPVFASSDIEIYPFQIAAASFALRSPYQKGVVLCDEAGMGKSHEAMLIMAQKWLEGKIRILLAVPNADLLFQWVEMIDRYYTVPYVVLTNRDQWNENSSDENPNAFEQNAIVITTYDFAADNQAASAAVKWDLTVLEEANALSPVYQEGNKQAKALKHIARDSFKLLLTGTPIEKNIMDLYGLIWFIDETVLPGEKEFLARYLRKPENYPELAERVSKYCFRTLRSQAKGYAKVPQRILITCEYTPTPKERELYDLLVAYINKPNKLAFPEMDQYDLALRLLGLQSSSTATILHTIKGIIKRLEAVPDTHDEFAEWQQIQAVAESIRQDAKAKKLFAALQSGFALIKKCGANKKAVIFTESVETQKMLYELLSGKYKAFQYNGGTDYSVIRQFKTDGEVLISTDNGAKGFNLEEAAFVIHYDLLYNTLKMEQRIDRCHRLGQGNDVISLAFIDKNNFSDVRKLELVNKRMLVTDGVFGVSDEVVGGFTDDLDSAFEVIAQRIRTKAQVESDYQRTLAAREDENKQLISAAEDILFTTFTKELADKVKLTPRYVGEKADEINAALWNIVKWFFERYNAAHDDCYFEIDDTAKKITATNYIKLPYLFYYWDGSRNKRYQSLKAYGMAKDFKPRYGRITLSSIIGRGIIHELECPDTGTLTVDADMEPCEIALYSVAVASSANRARQEYSVLAGKTESGRALPDEECRKILHLPVAGFSEDGHVAPHWLKSTGRPHELDRIVPAEGLITVQSEKLSPVQAEEIDKIKLRAKAEKAAMARELDELDAQAKAAEKERGEITNDRLKILALDKKISLLRQDFMRKQENQFFDAMRLDMELEQQIKEFTEKQKLTAKIVREFIVDVEGQQCSSS